MAIAGGGAVVAGDKSPYTYRRFGEAKSTRNLLPAERNHILAQASRSRTAYESIGWDHFRARAVICDLGVLRGAVSWNINGGAAPSPFFPPANNSSYRGQAGRMLADSVAAKHDATPPSPLDGRAFRRLFPAGQLVVTVMP